MNVFKFGAPWVPNSIWLWNPSLWHLARLTIGTHKDIFIREAQDILLFHFENGWAGHRLLYNRLQSSYTTCLCPSDLHSVVCSAGSEEGRCYFLILPTPHSYIQIKIQGYSLNLILDFFIRCWLELAINNWAFTLKFELRFSNRFWI